jgi:hypothetical protein
MGRPVLKAPQVIQDVMLLVPFCMTSAGARGMVNDSKCGQVEDALATRFCMVPSVALTARPSYIRALQGSSQVGVHRGHCWHSWSLHGFLLGLQLGISFSALLELCFVCESCFLA